MAKKRKRKRKRIRTPSRAMVERTTKALNKAFGAVRKKGAKRRRIREENYAKVVDEYIRDVYVPRGKEKERETVSPAERRYIAQRTSLDAVATRKAKQTRSLFQKFSEKGKYAGQFKVLRDTPRLKKGQKVSAATVRRSMAASAYWNKVQMIRDALEEEVPTSEIRSMLKAAKQAGLRTDGANVVDILHDSSPELRADVKPVTKKRKTGRKRPTTVKEAQDIRRRSVAAKRGHETRRRNIAKRRRSALKGWRTRRGQ